KKNKNILQKESSYDGMNRQGELTKELKGVHHDHEWWHKLTGGQQEALDMIMHKVSRIVCGDNLYIDSWRDIAGYAQVIVDALETTVGASDASVKRIVRTKDGWRYDN